MRCSHPRPDKGAPWHQAASIQRNIFSQSPNMPYTTGNPSPGFEVPLHQQVCSATLDNTLGMCLFPNMRFAPGSFSRESPFSSPAPLIPHVQILAVLSLQVPPSL